MQRLLAISVFANAQRRAAKAEQREVSTNGCKSLTLTAIPRYQVCEGISCTWREGTSPTVVLLHGIGSNAKSFDPLFDVLPEHLKLLAWNAPGYLDSDPMGDLWPLPQDYARRLAQLLDAMTAGAVHLVGHSLGALIAASFARLFPDRVKSLVLASPACGYCVPRGGDMPAGLLSRIEDLNKLGPVQFARLRAAKLVHDPARNEDVVNQVEATMAQANASGYAQAVRLLASGDLPGDLAHVPHCPRFIIGTEDRITPLDQTERAASAWAAAHGRNPKVIAIKDAGHAVYRERPREICAALVDVLSESQSDARQMAID